MSIDSIIFKKSEKYYSKGRFFIIFKLVYYLTLNLDVYKM